MTMPASTWPLPSEARLPITRTFSLVSRQLEAIVGFVPGVALAVAAVLRVSPSASAAPSVATAAAAAAAATTALLNFRQVVYNLGEL